MSTISSKPIKRHSLSESISIVAFIVLILVLLITPFTGNLHNFFGSALGSLGHTSTNLSAVNEASFTSDLQYWDRYCTPGWSSDAVCEAIALRAQSCSISVDSAYCSQYDAYMQKFK